MANKVLNFGGRKIGQDCPVFVIAEVGINHNGDMKLAEKLLIEAVKAGADAVKLQTYLTEKRVGRDSPVYDILKKCELSFDEQERLFELGHELGVMVFSTPFDDDSVEFLESVNTPVYKVASFDSVNKTLLRKISATKKPVIMSTGMTSLDELGAAWKALGGKDDGTGCDLALLHCVSSYPLDDKKANLAVVPYLHELHGGPVGYSDHTIGIEVPALAVAAGAQLIEKHFTLDTSASGPDHAMSADPKTLQKMIEKIRWVEKVMGVRTLGVREAETSIVPFRRMTD